MRFVPCTTATGLCIIEGTTGCGKTTLCEALSDEAELAGFLVTRYSNPGYQPCNFQELVDYINIQFHIYRKACDDIFQGKAQLIFLDGWFYTARAWLEWLYENSIVSEEEYDTCIFLLNALVALQPFMPEMIIFMDEKPGRCLQNMKERPLTDIPTRDEIEDEKEYIYKYNLLRGDSFISSRCREWALDVIADSEQFQKALKLLCPVDVLRQWAPNAIDPRFKHALNSHTPLAKIMRITMVNYRTVAGMRRAHAGDGKLLLPTIVEQLVYKLPRQLSFAHVLARNPEIQEILLRGDHRLLDHLSSHYF